MGLVEFRKDLMKILDDQSIQIKNSWGKGCILNHLCRRHEIAGTEPDNPRDHKYDENISLHYGLIGKQIIADIFIANDVLFAQGENRQQMKDKIAEICSNYGDL